MSTEEITVEIIGGPKDGQKITAPATARHVRIPLLPIRGWEQMFEFESQFADVVTPQHWTQLPIFYCPDCAHFWVDGRGL